MAIISQLRNNKILLKGGLFSLFSFFNQGVGFLLLIILAKYIVPAEYGTLSLFNTIVTFLGFLHLECMVVKPSRNWVSAFFDIELRRK